MELGNEKHAWTSLDSFSQHIRNMIEPDYGDFMREANHDLLALREVLDHRHFGIQKKLGEMQMYTQFHPNWEVEPTRLRLLKDAEELKTMI